MGHWASAWVAGQILDPPRWCGRQCSPPLSGRTGATRPSTTATEEPSPASTNAARAYLFKSKKRYVCHTCNEERFESAVPPLDTAVARHDAWRFNEQCRANRPPEEISAWDWWRRAHEQRQHQAFNGKARIAGAAHARCRGRTAASTTRTSTMSATTATRTSTAVTARTTTSTTTTETGIITANLHRLPRLVFKLRAEMRWGLSLLEVDTTRSCHREGQEAGISSHRNVDSAAIKHPEQIVRHTRKADIKERLSPRCARICDGDFIWEKVDHVLTALRTMAATSSASMCRNVT